MTNTASLPDIRNAKNIGGKRVLVRVDFNVPTIDDEIGGVFRLKASFDTISYLKEQGAKVILMSHMSDNKSLMPVYTFLKKHYELSFVESGEKGAISEAVDQMKNGDIILIENLRFHSGEEENSSYFNQYLSFLGDVYVNEAFSVSHRNHASIVGVPDLIEHYAGISFQKEVEELSKALKPQSPSLFILGGAKFETKEPLIRKLLETYDKVFIGGALAHDFLKAKGYNVGRSLVSKNPNVSNITEHKNIFLPKDVTLVRNEEILTQSIDDIQDDDVIVDIGPDTATELEGFVKNASFILWNGPLGNYEKGFGKRTEELATLVAESKAISIVGGGDTITSIENLNLEDKFSHLSTGGGAMIDFLSDGTLPGIEALKV